MYYHVSYNALLQRRQEILDCMIRYATADRARANLPWCEEAKHEWDKLKSRYVAVREEIWIMENL